MPWFPENEDRVPAAGGKRVDGLSMGGMSKVREARAGGIGGLGYRRPPGSGDRRWRASLIRDRHAKGLAMRQRGLRSRMEIE